LILSVFERSCGGVRPSPPGNLRRFLEIAGSRYQIWGSAQDEREAFEGVQYALYLDLSGRLDYLLRSRERGISSSARERTFGGP